MSALTKAHPVLDREFLEIRHTVLTLAASLDRLQRAGDRDPDDRRWHQLRAGIDELLAEAEGRAERIQQIFSRTYDPDWRGKFGL